MATAIRPIGHEDRLSLVDHLEELRTRLIVSGVALAVAFGLCMWQNHELLHIINKPLEAQTETQVKAGRGPLGQTALAQQGVLNLAREVQVMAAIFSAPNSGLPPQTRDDLRAQIPRLEAAVAKIPKEPQGNLPVTLGVGEPFTATLTVVLYFALVLSLPVILFELYGFLLPAFSPTERKIALPLLLAVPFLFVIGVLFGYFVVLPTALHFFQNFNSEQFNVLVQGSQYYRFAGMVLLAMGLVFQVPVAILGATRMGIVTPDQLRKHRRYAIVACAAIAAFLPGDAVTLLLETVPLYLLYELSIALASLMERRDRARLARESPLGPAVTPGQPATAGAAGDPMSPAHGAEISVQRIIDHVDEDLSQ
jgi:sec-independent protein translocase protein TatC